jgi:hypothetical protein
MQIQVHPAADLFPMMTPEELQELAADIQTSGLRNPIVLDHTGKVLIDGRNRLAACELGKVEPTFAKLAKDDDPLAYIVSMNVMHRFLNKGQQAMALAMVYPEPEKGGRGKNSNLKLGFSSQRLSLARTVLRYSVPLAQSVLNGTKPLNDALATVKQQEQYQQSDEAKLTRLRESAPDLAEQVNEERLKINEAIAALTAREQELREVAERGHRAAGTIAAHFLGAALAIFQARKSGEHIVIAPDEMQQLHEAMTILQETA